MDYTRGSVKLEKDDLLVCTTDGILHISDEQKHEYGPRRLTDFVRRNRDRSAQGIVDAVLAEVSAYSTASMNDDDKVLIVLKVTADKKRPLKKDKNLSHLSGILNRNSGLSSMISAPLP